MVTLLATAGSLSAETLTHTLVVPSQDIRIGVESGQMALGVSGSDLQMLTDPGSPELPYRVINFVLPVGETVASFRVTAMSDAEMRASGAKVKAAGPVLSENGIEGEAQPLASSSKDGVFPSERVRYLGTGYFHGRGIASFAVFPVVLEDGAVMLNERMTLEVETGAPAEPITVTRRERFREGFQKQVYSALERFTVNPEMSRRYGGDEVKVKKQPGGFAPTMYPSLEGSPVDYLIITTDALQSEYQRLADWKTAKGMPTVIRTIEWIEANTRHGVDRAETLRFFIQDAYAKWGITYLLLGGDTDVLPARYAYSRFYQGGTNTPAEMYFACLDGSWNDTHDNHWGEGVWNMVAYDNPDLYPEIYEGRISCTPVEDVTTVIDKIIDYETPVNRDYMNRSLFLAEVLFPVDWTLGKTITGNGADYPEVIVNTSYVGVPADIVRMYETDWLYAGSVNENKQAVLDSLESGFNHVNHVGHGFRFNMSVGDASILNGDADVLSHAPDWFNLYMLNCTAAAFDFSCLAEHYMENPNGGAVSVIGANESAFPNAAASYMNEYYNLLFQQDVVHIGEAFARSRLPRTPNAVFDGVDLWTHFIYTLLGDPEMPLFTAQVDTMDAFHVSSVGLGAQSILVNVSSLGSPVDSAQVCLSKGTDDYVVGATNALGNVILDFTTESAGSISVVCTALNKARKQTWITVNPGAGPYVSLNSIVTIDDDQSGGTFGNSDGAVDAGETIDFTLELTNSGGAPSDSVYIVLRSSDGQVVVTDSIAAFGAIGAGGNKTALDPVRVQFDPSILDETAIHFDLEVREFGGATWMDDFAKEVHAPQLELIRLRIDDSIHGDGDGIISPNEQFLLYYELKNYGTGTANDLTATLQDVDGQFVFTDSTDSYPDLPLLAQSENVAGFLISEADTTLENALRISITDLHSREYVDTFELRVPDPPDSLVFNTSLGPDRLEISWQKSPSPDVARYNVYVSDTQGGPYTLANADPAQHAVYLNTGLNALTRYYYVITAIDRSGNESGPSPEYSATTNVPIAPGFPIPLAHQTPSSPAVGDIDGDGANEIVVGNAHVYAWHYDGIEIVDGDADPQTWGVLNTRGDEFAPAIALAEVTGSSPGLEIVAADLFSPAVYCFSETGDTIPGWPQWSENEFRAPACAGDIDGDGDQEILAIDAGGVIYAWHGDGTEYRDGDSNPATQGVFYRTPATTYHYQPLALCDLDGDNKDEIIAATRGGKVYALNEDGTAVPGWPFTLPGEAAGGAVVGDVDGDGLLEVLVHSKTSEVYLINDDGTVAAGSWPRFISLSAAPFFTPSPALADFNNDGKLEAVVVGQVLGNYRLYVIDYQGNLFPNWPVTFTTADPTECSPTVADVDGDGVQDVIIGDEAKFIYAFDINGASVPGFPITTFDAVRATPFLTDVDKDGDLDMVVHSWDQNIYVYDLAAPYDPNLAQWPTLQGNVNRNGCHNYLVPTAVENATFTFRVRGDAINLMWLIPAVESSSYDLDRAQISAGETSEYVRVANGLPVDAAGFVTFNDGGVEQGRTYIYRLTRPDGEGEPILSQEIYVPVSRAGLGQNFPNPFNPTTRIAYWVPEGGKRDVQLLIYDVSGARVRTLVNESKRGGRYEVQWNGRDDAGNQVASGVYFYRLSQPGYAATKKMVLLK